MKKTLTLLISLTPATLLGTSAFAAKNSQTIERTAERVALEVTKANMASMGDRLDLQVFGISKSGHTVKVELGVGTTDHPARMHNCISVSFDENDSITIIENVVNASECS